MGSNKVWQNFDIKNSRWTVPVRYSNLTPLVQGAYGQVCSADDEQTRQKVAIKKLSRPFDQRDLAKRAYREIKLLKHVDNENLISLLDVFAKAEAPSELNDIYLSMNLMARDLGVLLNQQILEEGHVMYFTYQILRGLKYLHSAGIIHRDLKPSNLVVDENNSLKIIDFGLSRSSSEKMTGYVASRWYRAPEIMVNWTSYNKAVDVWSVGCIIVEMYLRKVLFPGNENVDQLKKILRVTGFPKERFLSRINEYAREFLKNMSVKPTRVHFPTYFGDINSPNAIDLIDKMLQLDPTDRITCERALEHPYLKTYHDPDDEPEGSLFEDVYENQELPVERWKEIIFHEIQTFVSPKST